MLFVRPIKPDDLDDLKRLAGSAGPGLTTLPDDKSYLQNKVEDSQRAFDARVRKPGSESYLFVLEDAEKKQVVGTSGIISKVGGFEPFYTYQIRTEHYADEVLRVNKDLKVLHLHAAHEGPSEICSLFLSPQYRQSGWGRLLSLARFLFMAQFPRRFEKEVISELRGVSDDEGRSLFWECVGRHFFETDFVYADFLSGLGNKDFIKHLMPRYPIYIGMLPRAVQGVIGKVHPRSQRALDLLLKDGFTVQNEVDIFDAGPTVKARLSEIRTVKECVISKVAQITSREISSPDFMVGNTRLDFRVCLGKVKRLDDQAIVLEEKVAQVLGVKEGDEVSRVALKRDHAE